VPTVLLAVLATVVTAVPPAQAASIQTFKNRSTSRCLDDSVQFGLRTFYCNGMNYQQWRVTRQSNTLTEVVFRNVNTDKCLDDSIEFGVRTFPCNGLSYQRWNAYKISGGSLQIRNKQTGRCLVDIGANVDNGRLAVQGCDGYNPAFQLWY